MFDNLIESQAKRKSSLGQTITSVIVHAVLILAAVKATQGIAEAAEEKPIDTTVVFLKPPAETPPPGRPAGIPSSPPSPSDPGDGLSSPS